ncbi:unnamed protein product [Adineta ricciae]|uniref:G-protein coupled receptors family 1 profile domain-containing protein n=1 Tax=Adineta ricciae TaxID=249248 RepID=A0A815NRJ8_ADIRI|nr:unnamed protein product [Adineta ricciae]
MILNLGLGMSSTMYALDHPDPLITNVTFCKLRIYLNQFVALTYRWSLTAACFDRYLLSSTNIRLRQFARIYVARRVVGIIVLIWLILPVHALVLYNLSAGICGILNNIAGSLYHSIFTTMASCILPSSIMFICVFRIRHNLAEKERRRQPISHLQTARSILQHSNRKRDRQVLAMLFAQVLMYFITVVPLMIIYIYTAVTISLSNKSIERIAIERFSGFIAEVIILLFPAISFYLYTLSSRTFRKELMRLLRSLLLCNWHNDTHRIQPTTNNNTGRQVIGRLPTAVHIPLQTKLQCDNELGNSTEIEN